MISAILSWLTGGFVDKLVGLGNAYFQKQISQAEFESRVKIAAEEASSKIEQSWADASKSITESTQQTLRTSPIVARVWAIVLFLQVFVLVWYQIGAPAFLVITGTAWPHPGISLEWAYLLVGSMVGAGPFVFRRGS
jgi:hypothetical protein